MHARIGALIVAAVASLLLLPAAALAEAEAKVLKTIPMDETPVATAVTPDGQTIYVLTGKALLIYAPSGILRERLALDEPADSISLPPRGNFVILGSSTAKNVKVIGIDIVQEIDTAGSPSKGPADAPVTITVFTDFQCPYCVSLEDALFKVAEDYPNEVRIVYKAFPLAMHNFARKAALAAVAADAQGRFWLMHDRLFAARGKLSDEEIAAAAKDAELDIAAFEAAMEDPATAARVDADFRQGQSLGVRGTPTVFVNGRQYSGQRSAEGFAAAIDALLGKKEEK